MKIKIKSEKELKFQDDLFCEVYEVPEEGICSAAGLKHKRDLIAGKVLNVELHKFSKSSGDSCGYVYEWEITDLPKHYTFIYPYEVESIVEY